jgi:UPF0042 nucleotide-binding protein
LIVIVTGLSGSGKTVALRAMEDTGFTCVDNLPPQLIDAFVSNVSGKDHEGSVAVGIDIRKKDFLDDLDAALPPLREKYHVSILFLDAERDDLVRRFKETRRPHPLMGPDVKEIQEAIRMEKSMLLSLREEADTVLDTSSLTPHQLRQQMMSRYGGEGAGDTLRMTLMSFGFKYGVPNNVDMLFDVRFLPNPHFIPELKEFTGLDEPVREFVLKKAETMRFLEKVRDFLDFLIPLFRKEGKTYLTIGIGCTGGRHRSAAVVEEVASILRKEERRVTVIHRDI